MSVANASDRGSYTLEQGAPVRPYLQQHSLARIEAAAAGHADPPGQVAASGGGRMRHRWVENVAPQVSPIPNTARRYPRLVLRARRSPHCASLDEPCREDHRRPRSRSAARQVPAGQPDGDGHRAGHRDGRGRDPGRRPIGLGCGDHGSAWTGVQVGSGCCSDIAAACFAVSGPRSFW